MNQSLTDLLQKKRETSGTLIDWDARRDEYLKAVEDLYQQIQTILEGQPAVTLGRRSKTLSENYIGTYSAEDLILVIGDEQVRFSPRGRNIVGAAGRVDVVGERGEAMLIVQPDSKWEFVQTRQPKLSVVPFDESTFAEVLQLVMRG